MGKVKKCKNTAVYQFAWAGKIQKCCEKHARQIRGLGEVIGSPVTFERIITNEKCSSIVNEP